MTNEELIQKYIEFEREKCRVSLKVLDNHVEHMLKIAPLQRLNALGLGVAYGLFIALIILILTQ